MRSPAVEKEPYLVWLRRGVCVGFESPLFEDTRHCDNRIVTLYCNHRALTTAARVEFGETRNFYESEETYEAEVEWKSKGSIGSASALVRMDCLGKHGAEREFSKNFQR